jgi:ATP-dependent RNA helicase DeaD
MFENFSDFGLSDVVLDALKAKGFTAPTPIQAISLPRLLTEEGHLVVKARTGTGKTAAFGIPLVEKLTTGAHAPRAIILTPTRELCQQICKEIASLTTRSFPRITAVYGGSSIRNQIFDLKRGTEIVVGTPGRFMDLMERKALDLSSVGFFILDEADEMLDMGFLEDIETILKSVPPERRVALFSATMPDPILKVVRTHIGQVDILEDAAPEDEKPAVDQTYLIVKKEDRIEALRRIIDSSEDFYGLIFCATKIGADELCRRLMESGYHAEAIHGDLSQEARERTLRRFRSRLTTILVATDVAARGLDIEKLTHVINFDLPNDAETYVHRIGRTGRAGRRGRAVSIVLPAERMRMTRLSRMMERTLGSPISFMKVPQVKSVMKSIKRRIVNSVLALLPDEPQSEQPPVDGAIFADAQNGVQEGTQTGTPIDIPVGTPPDTPAEYAAHTEATQTAAPAALPASALLADPVAAVSRELIEKLGPEKAVESLIALSYGELLDPARYAAIVDFSEATSGGPLHGEGRSRHSAVRQHDHPFQKERPFQRERSFQRERPFSQEGTARPEHSEGRPQRPDRARPERFEPRSERSEGRPERKFSRPRRDAPEDGATRVYVGLGRQHGASARDVADFLSRVGNVPFRLVDGIEMNAFCSFATLPEEAARRACDFSRNAKDEPTIKPASVKE